MSIASLTEGNRVTRQAITKHLRVLESAGLIRSEWRGRECRWRLEEQRFKDARHYLDQISAHWDAALGRLRELVEN